MFTAQIEYCQLSEYPEMARTGIKLRTLYTETMLYRFMLTGLTTGEHCYCQIIILFFTKITITLKMIIIIIVTFTLFSSRLQRNMSKNSVEF